MNPNSPHWAFSDLLEWSASQIQSPFTGGIKSTMAWGCCTGPPAHSYVAWGASMTTLCQSWLHPPQSGTMNWSSGVEWATHPPPISVAGRLNIRPHSSERPELNEPPLSPFPKNEFHLLNFKCFCIKMQYLRGPTFHRRCRIILPCRQKILAKSLQRCSQSS
jgi:hypothetical protein